MSLIEFDRNPSSRELRRFAGLSFAASAAAIGALLFFKSHAHGAAGVVWGLGVLVALLGLVRPALVKPIYLGMTFLTRSIALAITYVLLGLLYYLIVTPVGFVMTRAGRDTLRRKADPGATTYWTPCDPGARLDRYFRQY